jgi:hypothetical protein
VLLTRAVPVLLIFMILLFLTTEVWQVFSDIPDASLVGVVVLFGALGSVFVAARLPNEVRALERDVGVDPPLRRRQRFVETSPRETFIDRARYLDLRAEREAA